MTQGQKESIAGALIYQKFSDGETIVHKGDQAASYYIIKEGKVSCVKDGVDIRELSKGDSFGEQALYKNSVRTLDVVAKGSGVRMLALGREALQNILGNKIQKVINNNWTRWAFEKNKLLSKLTQVQIEKIISNTQIIDYDKGALVLREEDSFTDILVVIRGQCSYNARSYPQGTIFSEDFLWPQENLNKKLEHNFIAEGFQNTIAKISLKKFNEILGGTLQKILAENEQLQEVRIF